MSSKNLLQLLVSKWCTWLLEDRWEERASSKWCTWSREARERELRGNTSACRPEKRKISHVRQRLHKWQRKVTHKLRTINPVTKINKWNINRKLVCPSLQRNLILLFRALKTREKYPQRVAKLMQLIGSRRNCYAATLVRRQQHMNNFNVWIF